MKLFKEIRRRTRNAALAIAGKGPGWQEKLEPVKIIINQTSVETFCVEQMMPFDPTLRISETKIKARYYEDAALELGDGLLRNGLIKFEVIDLPGHDVSVLRAQVSVVRPEKEGAV